MSDAALELRGVGRTFHQGGRDIEVLRDVQMSLVPGEIVALVGPSGAGKSTLLHIAGLLERPDAGEVIIGDEACSGLAEADRTRLRRGTLGFVYQFHHLLPEFSALENIMLPQMIAGTSRAEARVRAGELLEMMGLGDRATHRPGQLSGGEQQRIAIARSVANAPAILLADEPTGNLDPETAGGVFDQMLKLVRGARLAALIATHNLELAAKMDRTLQLRDGRVEPA
ncbi:MAG: ABC transporter ATP-binding protein [Rhodospirillaceae bacterium]|jgi:lipoprotein-releasing system ATP-binding protein|nr:ABC transporter ATP-binding protein [Rhodospirillaceae bacterium]MBT4771019.1 ABC transporter ATP-binding protein [Rhodospirillaceae bacterium]MBT5359186.1 ABC transporter ATP-binding protein [Rhodospirillaceae bacterium]MBT5769056.1 ABC transporter ATP-binding protein [Rhodospirillaceae bacterium]MBT6310593.1 ABC transporter ATP-binding protein [Rhodospirillaceae bacterium]